MLLLFSLTLLEVSVLRLLLIQIYQRYTHNRECGNVWAVSFCYYVFIQLITQELFRTNPISLAHIHWFTIANIHFTIFLHSLKSFRSVNDLVSCYLYCKRERGRGTMSKMKHSSVPIQVLLYYFYDGRIEGAEKSHFGFFRYISFFHIVRNTNFFFYYYLNFIQVRKIPQ